MQQSVSCVTKGVLSQQEEGTAPLRAVTFRERYLPIRGRQRLELSILHESEIASGTTRPISSVARSAGYRYQVRQTAGAEVIAFHRHPTGRGVGIPFPHLHLHLGRALGAIDLGAKAHVPTGRVSLEAVVAFPIRELGVRPLRPDWATILAANQAAFDAKRTW